MDFRGGIGVRGKRESKPLAYITCVSSGDKAVQTPCGPKGVNPHTVRLTGLFAGLSSSGS